MVIYNNEVPLIVRKTLSMMLVVLVCISCTGCSIKDKAEVRMKISEFQHAINKMDADKMLDCIDPVLGGVIRILPVPEDEEALSELIGKIIDLLYVIDFDAANNLVEVFESVRIHVARIEVDSGRASVDAKISYKINGEKEKIDLTLKLAKKRGTWYLTLF